MKFKGIIIIFLFGLVSLFGDIVYEGVRSVSGPFLASIGASAVIIGFFSGFGEFLTYFLRFFSGYISDKKKLYWTFTIIGYSLICFLPLLAFTKIWQIAIILILFERIGKAIRTPSRDALISIAGKNIGYGKSFGVHEVLDQIGGVLGPLIFFLSLSKFKNYSFAFNLMWFPCLLLILTLFFLKKNYTISIENEEKDKLYEKNKFGQKFIFYLFFVFFSVSGLITFPLISYHLSFKKIVVLSNIPVFYIIAMGVDGIVALFIGNLYDKIKLKSLIIVPFFTILLPFLSFSSNIVLSIIGIIIFGCILGCHETILRASVADIISTSKRGFAYGIFNSIYGIAFFIGSWIIGFLYENYFEFIPFYIIFVEIISFVFLIVQIKRKNVVEKAR
ncbi:MAG: MFS transporter [Candidatus Omnitrophica bacterium]|nr:MFS transporter [Candidatus Omnitrophota bacterium]MCM8802029.1 MFS transporter [Candidatus Omnitrophota bacterium]